MEATGSFSRRLAGVLAAAMLVAGCEASLVTPPPGSTVGPTSTGGPAASLPSGSPAEPSDADGPSPSFDLGVEASLPQPSLTEPFDIGQALFDPNRVTDAVVSLVAQMGVEIQAVDGTVLRAGEDAGVGRLVLTESEVRGMIEMAREDLSTMNESGMGSVPVDELFGALQPSLPSGYSLADFIDAFNEAYSSEPEAFVPQVLLGMPIDREYPLTRVQAWLVYIDGFLGSRGQTARPVAYTAAATTSLGTASAYQPRLASQVTGMSDAAWAYLLSRIPTLAYTIPFVTSPPGGVHEGHGGRGRPVVATATIALPPPLIDPSSGRVLLEPHRSASGITVAWSSAHQGSLARHGTLDQPLLTPTQTDASGRVQITFTPKQERADGRGQVVNEIASLFAEVHAAQLIRDAYFVAVSSGAIEAVLGLARGKIRSRPSDFAIAWHETDTYELSIRNKFDVTVEVGTGAGPGLLRVRRDGRNEAKGVLYNNGDGTYRGAMEAWVVSSMNGTSFVGECHDQADAVQALHAVGRVIEGGPLPPFVRVDEGTYGMQELMLYFYPASPPVGAIGPCHGTMDFTGGGPDGQPAGVFLPFNDSRWTAAISATSWQDGIGLGVFLPEAGTFDYTDNRQNGVDPNIFSQWNIVVTKRTDGP